MRSRPGSSLGCAAPRRRPAPGLATRRRLWGVLGTLWLWLASPVWAHTQFAPSTVNRYGKLVLSQAHGIRVLYTLMVGDSPALTMRMQADRSHDGHLDSQEQTLLCARLGAAAREGLALVLDQQPVSVDWEPPHCTLSGSGALGSDAVAALPIAMDLTARVALPLAPGQSRILRYEDRVAVSPIGEVELRIEESPDLRLIESWQGAAPWVAGPTEQGRAEAPPGPGPERVQRVYQTFGPPRSSMSDRSVSLRFAAATVPLLSPPRRPILLPIVAGGGAALAAALALVYVRWRSRLRRPAGG